MFYSQSFHWCYWQDTIPSYCFLLMMSHAADILELCSVLKYDMLITDRGNSNQNLMWESFVI